MSRLKVQQLLTQALMAEDRHDVNGVLLLCGSDQVLAESIRNILPFRVELTSLQALQELDNPFAVISDWKISHTIELITDDERIAPFYQVLNQYFQQKHCKVIQLKDWSVEQLEDEFWTHSSIEQYLQITDWNKSSHRVS